MEQVFFIVILLAQLAFFGFLIIFLIYFSSSIFVWPPSIPTDKKARREIVGVIKSRYGATTNFKIVDLGSGYGHLLVDLAKNFKHAEIIGVELLWLPYLFSKISAKRFKNIRITKQNLYDHDLSSYNAVIFFLRKDHLVDKKIRAEMKAGAIIISNNYPLKTFEPLEVKEISDIFTKRKSRRKIYFYQI